jgi:hypothetical protein
MVNQMNYIFLYTKYLTFDFIIICVALMWILNGCGSTQESRLHDITGHLPNDGATLNRTQFLKYPKKVVTRHEQRKTQYLYSRI